MSNSNDDKLYRIRHSAAHVMAQAVMEMFPPGDVKIAIGPPIEDGFYYDFELPRPLTPEDLPAIEHRMREIIAQQHPFVRREVSADEARAQFAGQPYKLELVDGLEKGALDEYGNPAREKAVISFYVDGPFVDLCRGPHVEHTGQINPNALKLMSIAGAYWRGDERNPMLTRIYGTAWETATQLEEYLHRLEEARRRDHRRLGKELQLFILPEEVGLGLPVWLPKGAVLRKQIEEFIYQNQVERGYQHVYSPHIGKKSLWVKSGHWELYSDKMYAPMDIDGVEHLLKPMNCPMHMMAYKAQLRSYKDLPLRIAETATVYRREQSGELAGLLRVRMITMDDAHMFVRPDQIKGEFLHVLDQALYQFGVFGFKEFEMWLSVRDPRQKSKYLGNDEQWNNAEQAIRDALESANVKYIVAEGEAKFYGPALDIMIQDALGRKWQCTTIQVDFQLPARFDLEYIDADGSAKQPVVLHRAPLGSMERFVAILIEHFAGAFPLWLSPVQVMLIPIADRHVAYAQQVARRLKDESIRAEVDARAERMNAKIRDAQLQKIPYMFVLGDREVSSGTVAVRARDGGDLGAKALDEAVRSLQQEIASKALNRVADGSVARTG